MKTNQYLPELRVNPMIVNNIAINEMNRKIDPILDKFDSNKRYILMNGLLETTPKPMNAIILPNLRTFEEKDETKGEIIDGLNNGKVIEEKPTNAIKVYLDYRIIRDPRAYTHLTVIRRQKMNKHKRIKWRKKMLSFILKKRLKRNIKTEKLFRAELLAQIKSAEEFDAEKYVRNILETIDNVPKPETRQQKIEKIKDLIRKNRRETNLVPPKFND